MRAPMEQEKRQPIGARFYLNAIRKRKKDNTNPDSPQQKYAQPECALRLRRRGAKAQTCIISPFPNRKTTKESVPNKSLVPSSAAQDIDRRPNSSSDGLGIGI